MKKFWLGSAICAALLIASCGNQAENAPIPTGDQVTIIPNVDFNALPSAQLAPAEWLSENGSRDGVVTTESGLQYMVNRQGDPAGVSPELGQIVQVHYEGRLPSGKIFDSSYERGTPSEFPSDQLVPGWVEALSLMKPGDKWTLFVPPALGYGEQGRPPVIPGNSVMIFQMELLGIDNSAEIAEAEITAAIEAGEGLATSEEWLANNATRDGVITTQSGLQYSIIESGDESSPTVNTDVGQYVQVHYEGRLKDGSIFDSSYARGEPAAFPSNQLVPGWVEALGQMRAGDQWVLYVSPELGYGKAGRAPAIPEDAVMIFRMDLLQLARLETPAESAPE